MNDIELLSNSKLLNDIEENLQRNHVRNRPDIEKNSLCESEVIRPKLIVQPP